MQDYTGAVVRGQYDKSTIIDAYDGTTGQETYDILDVVNTDGSSESESSETTQPEPVVQPPETRPVVVEEPKSTDKKKVLYPTHTVARGDTLSTIAQKYNVSVSDLREVNEIRGTNLSINQKLLIPRINGVQYTVQK